MVIHGHKQLPKNGTGVMSDQAQTVTYVYTKNSDKGKDSERAAAVTVVYADKDGKEIHAAKPFKEISVITMMLLRKNISCRSMVII